MGLPKLWGKDSSGNHGFAFSHVKTIYYNWSSKKLLSTKLSEMDTATNNRILKSDISNVQVNNQNKVPSSALVYGMNNQISELNASLSDRFKFVNSGSLKDIKSSGVYYVSNVVTDKPDITGGLYVFAAVDETNYIGLYICANSSVDPIIIIGGKEVYRLQKS